MQMLLGLAVMASVPAYWVLQWRQPQQLAGAWRIASLAPLIVMIPLLTHALIALSLGSNLWPLLVVMASPFCALYLLAVSGAAFMLAN